MSATPSFSVVNQQCGWGLSNEDITSLDQEFKPTVDDIAQLQTHPIRPNSMLAILARGGDSVHITRDSIACVLRVQQQRRAHGVPY